MSKVSNRINQLSESATIAMSQKSRELTAQGLDIINLSLGEPDFHTPDFIKDAAKEAIDNNFTTYMPVPGYLDLREAISKKFKRDNGLDYASNQIVVSNGAKHSLANVCLSLLNPGDEVLLPAPYWVTYQELAKLGEATPIVIPTSVENDFKITAEELEKYITPKTKLIIFSSPCNPSGSIYGYDELKAIAATCSKHENLYIIADEIYEHINFVGKHESLAQFENIYDRVITVNGVSKGFAMTGWRIGYIGAPKWIADACTKIQGQFTSGASSIAQRAAKAAIEATPKEVTQEMVAAFKQRRDFVLNALNNIPGVKTNIPEGAFYVFPDISAFFGKTHENDTINNASDLSMYLLLNAHVALVTGDAFGAPNCIRISYAASDEQLAKAMERIKNALAVLQ